MVIINCDLCGTLTKKKQKDITKSFHHFCSQECHNNFRRGKPNGRKGEVRLSMCGENNPSKRLEVRQKISLANKGRIVTELAKIKQSETKKRLFAEGKLKMTEEHKQKIRKAMIGRVCTWGDKIGKAELGKKMSIESRKKMSDNHWSKKENREEIISKIITPDSRRKHSELKKLQWQDPIYAKKTTEMALKGLLKRPTSYEKKISDLCIEHNLPFMYTGNGTFIIGTKNPDFKHKTLPIVIEVYNEFHHPIDYEKIRTEYFSQYGYKTIFINQTEVTSKDWKEICLKKIKIYEVKHGLF